MNLLAPFQEPLFRISEYGIPTCFAVLGEAEQVECALNISISIPALDMMFLIHQDIVSSDTALCDFP